MAKYILFDGTNTDLWRTPNGDPIDWQINDDGSMTTGSTDCVSTVTYGDAHIHVEFRKPSDDERKEGQFQDSNSGVYLQGCYEVQIIDSYGDASPKENPMGAIYFRHLPRVNADRPCKEWQTYDIYFRAPRFNDRNEMIECARATIIHNGICIHNNVEIFWATRGGLTEAPVKEGPLVFQSYRGDPVRFRNVWIETL